MLSVGRFCCDNPTCQRRTFAEDCGPSLPRFARRTREATAELLDLVGLSNAQAAARLARKRGLPVSADTLLRLERQAPLPKSPTPRVLGIDDFALRRGQTYGTIFVDLETHQPIGLVEGREASVVEAWLKGRVSRHPGHRPRPRGGLCGWRQGRCARGRAGCRPLPPATKRRGGPRRAAAPRQAPGRSSGRKTPGGHDRPIHVRARRSPSLGSRARRVHASRADPRPF